LPANSQCIGLHRDWRIWCGRDIHRLAKSRYRNPQRGSDAGRLNGVELAHPRRHEEALDEAEDPRKRRPAEAGVEDSPARSPQIEVVNAKSAEKQRQENSHNFVATRLLLLLVKDCLRI
jgi:hypothetical protein